MTTSIRLTSTPSAPESALKMPLWLSAEALAGNSSALFGRPSAACAQAQEPAPAEVYPDSVGKQEKADSLRTQYDETAALSRI